MNPIITTIKCNNSLEYELVLEMLAFYWANEAWEGYIEYYNKLITKRGIKPNDKI